MQSLNFSFEFNEDEEEIIRSIMSSHTINVWGDSKAKSIKHRLSEYTIKNQNGRCAYCENLLERGAVELEHFLPKEKFRGFTFEPLNLFSTCKSCNNPCNKKSEGLVDDRFKNGNVYGMNVFKILHPYLHNPKEHIVYESDYVIDRTKSTEMGVATVDFFEWDKHPQSFMIKRYMYLLTKDLGINIEQLIDEISTYKS